VPRLAPYYRQARVALAPLRFGAGMKGKVAEAMAHGVPVVTTTIGAEGIGLVDGETALIVDSPRDSAQAVESIFRDDDRWYRLARQGQAFVRASYSPEAVLPAVRQLMTLTRGRDR
jgi:glycosyltransferase involved in cell wall biosynthesis